MSNFTGIENAKTSEKLPPLSEGQYTLLVEALKVIDTRSKGKMFVAEFEVLESEGAKANPRGSRASHLIKMSLDSALGNIKGLIAAILGESEKNVTATLCDQATADDQPCRGAHVRAEAFLTKTKAGNDFTLVKYSAVPKNATATEKKVTQAAAKAGKSA